VNVETFYVNVKTFHVNVENFYVNVETFYVVFFYFCFAYIGLILTAKIFESLDTVCCVISQISRESYLPGSLIILRRTFLIVE
jgi:hypothetical protein